MADIVGEPFDEYVAKQILDRQRIHGLGHEFSRGNDALVYLNARSGWIKLSSGVVINDYERLQRIGLGNHPSFLGPNGSGTGLSNFFVLFGGTSDNAGTQYAGIDIISGQPHQDLGQSILNKVAYGIGGIEFGLRPMSGIISCETKFRNRGSIREGTVIIKAWNRNQLEIINLLYLRLGFPMLLEWGHSVIVDKVGNVDTKPNFSISSEFLSKKYKTDNDVLKALENKRKESAGNYDGMYGRVVNFDWTFNKDGSYDITLKLISVGAIVESFKVNTYIKDLNKKPTSQNDDSEPETDEDWITKYKYSHTIGNIFHIAYSRLDRGGNIGSLNKKDIVELSANEKFNRTLTNILTLGLYDSFGSTEVPEGLDKDYISVKNEGSDLYYIRFGELLNVIQSITPNNVTDSSKPVPLLNVKPLSEDGKEIPILMYTENYQISGDPRVSFVGGFNMNDIGEDNNNISIVPELNSNPFKIVKNSILLGNLNNVYINMGFILGQLVNNQDEDGKVILIDLLKAILDGVNRSLGNTNKLTVAVDETNNSLKFIDEVQIPGIERVLDSLRRESPIIDLYGYYQNKTAAGFVRDFSLKTEITNNLAAMMTIGATANASMVGEDATAFSRWNKGLSPIINEAIDYVSNRTETRTSLKQQRLDLVLDNIQLKKQFVDYIENYYNIFRLEIKNSDSTSQIVTNYLAFENQYDILRQQYIAGEKLKIGEKVNPTVTATSSRGFLPINLSLTMDGLSGIKIYQQIKVDTTYLPTEYPASLKFIIKGITNKVDKNGWITITETVSIPVIDAHLLESTPDATKSGVNDSNKNLPPTPVDRSENKNNVNANKLRATLTELGYKEKGKEIDNGGADISPQIEKAASAVLRTIKRELPSVSITVTGGNDIYHQNLSYSSRHKLGNAVDLTVTPSDPATLDKIVNILQRYAAGNVANFRFIDEYRNLSKDGTGNHFHISWGAGTESKNELNKAVLLAQQGKIVPIKLV